MPLFNESQRAVIRAISGRTIDFRAGRKSLKEQDVRKLVQEELVSAGLTPDIIKKLKALL